MQLNGYLKRIGYHGTPRVDRETLFAVHYAHRRTIPYENLDIALGRTLTLDEASFYNRLVTQGRGGWCYEMNGLLAWALSEIGFDVTLLAGTVGRQSPDTIDGRHLILRVMLNEPYLADVGFGTSCIDPIPLKVGIYQQGFRTYSLTQEGERWFLTNHTYGGPGSAGPGMDFTLRPHRLCDYATHCTDLQTSPESLFVQRSICHRVTEEGLVTLQGAVLRTTTVQGMADTIIETRDSYQQALCSHFGIQLSEAEVSLLWETVWERHLIWLATRDT